MIGCVQKKCQSLNSEYKITVQGKGHLTYGIRQRKEDERMKSWEGEKKYEELQAKGEG
jgi:hypothetical protein